MISKARKSLTCFSALAFCLLLNLRVTADAPAKSPFPYVPGTAYHILPETHTDESGYFSIIEGHNGKIYVGTAKYGFNAFLVEFDPTTKQQRIVIDTNKVNGLTATGFASQSKIHTRNFVGPSGKIYCGSQEGYRRGDDKGVYPGGYVMTYDPTTDKAESLGMPMVGEGVIDVVADEARGLLYIVTTTGEDGVSHWMVGDIKTKTYRDLGLSMTAYASTLMDKRGLAHAITKDFQLATYNPATQKVTLRDIMLNKEKWKQKDSNAIPTWQLAPDNESAYLILMNDPALFKIELKGKESVRATILGNMIQGTGYDSRASLTVAPDGRVYATIKVNNETGYGTGYLHHLTRYDPKKKKTEDLGVLTVKNPNFFDFGPRADGTKPPWSHGYHNLPDGTMTPLHGHQGLIAASNGNLYALILYPYTLLEIEGVSAAAKNKPKPAVKATKNLEGSVTLAKVPPSKQYMDFALRTLDRAEKDMPEIARVAEIVARRHLAGGALGTLPNGQVLPEELTGRSGGMINFGYGRTWSKDRTPEQDALNIAIAEWDRAPRAGELERLQKMRDAGYYIVGFGPRAMPELAEYITRCDAFFDTGFGADDRVTTLDSGERAARGNVLVNMVYGWSFIAEVVGACTRQGKMPVMYQSYMMPGAREWAEKYIGKSQFHDDLTIAPIKAGDLGRSYIREMRANINLFQKTESDNTVKAADMIASEIKNNNVKIPVAMMGHSPGNYVGRDEDAQWCQPFGLEGSPAQAQAIREKTTDGALVVRLGYTGIAAEDAALFHDKHQRLILITSLNPRPENAIPDDTALFIDMGWKYGDAAVTIPGYPIPIFAPSGIMQVVAYESLSAEVLNRLPKPQ